MLSPLEAELGKLIECPVCFDSFDRPRMLWCAHAFCQRCIGQMTNSNRIICPLCRKITRVYRQACLPKAYFVQDMLQLHRKLKSMRQGPPIIIVTPIQTSKSDESCMPIKVNHDTPTGNAPNNVTTRQTKDAQKTTAGNDATNCVAGGDSSGEAAKKCNTSPCPQCTTEYPFTNLWVCIDCSYVLSCSRCTMLHHRCHSVKLAADLRQERKKSVNRWLREMTIAIDQIYTNRINVNCELASLRFSRWKTESIDICVTETASTFVDSNNNAEWLEMENFVKELKHELEKCVTRLNLVRSEQYLFIDDVTFASELNSLPTNISVLLEQQEQAINMQCKIRDRVNQVASKE